MVGHVVVIGAAAEVRAYGLAGARVLTAGDGPAVRAAWAGMPADTVVAVLTETAAAHLGDEAASRPEVLRVVIPG